MIEALGGTVVEYAGMRKCCGFPIITMNKEASLKQAGTHMADATDADADCVVTPCPLCHLNLDLQQPLAAKVVGRQLAMPVLHLPQLVGLALGIYPGSRHEPPRRQADVGDRLEHLGRRRGGLRRATGRARRARDNRVVRILTVVGNRPQFVKAAAVSGPLRERHEEMLVHTGQHYDDTLSRVFFDELGLARPDLELDIAGGSNTSQIARMLRALEPLIADVSPDAALVYGDTNSTLAGALAAAGAEIPVIHVEAGMRSGDMAMPEERNRILTDHLADAPFVQLGLWRRPTASRERLRTNRGRRRRDGRCRDAAPAAARAATAVPAAYGLEPGGYLLVTAHRAQNVDDPDRLRDLVELIERMPARALMALHPRTRAAPRTRSLLERLEDDERLVLTAPLGYMEFTALLCQARSVLTDSGGVQKEAYLAGCPASRCGPRPSGPRRWRPAGTRSSISTRRRLRGARAGAAGRAPPLYGDGRAAQRCVAAIDAL